MVFSKQFLLALMPSPPNDVEKAWNFLQNVLAARFDQLTFIRTRFMINLSEQFPCNSWSTKIVCNNVENIAYIRTPPGFTRCAHLFQLSDVHTLKFLWLLRYIICSSSMWEFPDYYVTWALVVEESWEAEKQRACCGMERSSTLGKLGRVGCCRLKVAFWNMNGLSEHHHFWLASWFNFIHDA